jgi:hypothetical protein
MLVRALFQRWLKVKLHLSYFDAGKHNPLTVITMIVQAKRKKEEEEVV